MSPARNSEATNFSLEDNQSQPTTRKRQPKKGFYVPITEDGKIDEGRVTDPVTLDRLRSALGTPATPVAEKPKVEFNREYIPHIYSLLEVGIQRAGRIFLKWPAELADEMHFAPEKKEALIAPTAAVLEKYAPAWLIDNQDIAALGAALTDAVNEMVNSGVQRYAAKVRAAQMAEAPVDGQPVNGAVIRQ